MKKKAPAKTKARAKPKQSSTAAPKAKSKRTLKAEIVPAEEPVRKVVAELHEGEEPARVEPEIFDDIPDFDSGDTTEEILPAVSTVSRKRKSADGALTTTDPIHVYLQEVRKYPVLTREQEQEIAKRYFETKDPLAAQALVTANLRFVVKIAAEYSKFGARLIDLVQEGNMGLMHAVKDFNPYKNVRLITYAVWWIRGYIQEYLMKQYSLVKIGTTHNQKKLFYRLQKEKEALDALGMNPTVAQIGTKLGIPEEEVQEMAQRMRGRDVSLSQPLDEDSGTSMIDFQRSDQESPDVSIGKQEELTLLRERLKELEPTLNDREKILLEERLLSDEPLTLQEIGEKYGITREAVRQLEARLMEKIRKGLKV